MFTLHRVALDNFGHLSSKDRSVLVDFPLHNLAALSAGGGMSSVLPSSGEVTGLSEQEDNEGGLPSDALPAQTDNASHLGDQVLLEEKDVLVEEKGDNGQS